MIKTGSMPVAFSADIGTPEGGCPWPGSSFTIGAWPSGVYMARLGDDDGAADVYFVVRRRSDARPKAILAVVPFTTIQAYNDYSGKSFYTLGNPAERLSFRRPTPFHDVMDGAQGYLRHFLDWLDRNAADDLIPGVDFISSIDLATGQYALFPDQYRMVITMGHDEYWSDVMMDTMLNFVWQGGNAAFLSGNTSDGRVVFDFDFEGMSYKQGDRWRYREAKDFALIGVQTPLITGNPDDPTEVVPRIYEPYQVLLPSHWAMDGVSDPALGVLRAGLPHTIVDYEADVREAKTPSNFEAIATTRFHRFITTQFGVFQNRAGFVFSAGTTGWGRGLSPVERGRGVDVITRNVVRRFSGLSS